MEVTYGAQVEDRNGRILGTVNTIMRDMWTGEISKFSVTTEQTDTVLFYSPEDVSDASDTRVKLKVTFGDINRAIQFGARVFDKNHQLIGTVDYPVSDSLTGEVRKFKVKTPLEEQGLLFSTEDVEDSSPDEVRLKISVTKTAQESRSS